MIFSDKLKKFLMKEKLFVDFSNHLINNNDKFKKKKLKLTAVKKEI